MNLKCLICSDLFTPYAEIYATTCGHLFHYHCLLQWINRSKTCPQCRSKATEKTIFRIYLSVEENVETTDISVLQNQIENLHLQLKMKNLDVKNANDTCDTAKKQNLGLREENKSQENQIRVLESAMHALKEQISYFKSKSKECKKLEEELSRLRKKINDVKNVDVVLNGTKEEVQQMLRNTQDPTALSIMVATLRKELIHSNTNKRQLQSTINSVRSESQLMHKKIENLKDENSKLAQEVESHKSCEKERQYLKNKLVQLKNEYKQVSMDTSTSSINRITTESPIPVSRLTDSENNSPSVSEAVQSIKDSDSPFLRVQTSSIGLSGLLNYNDKSSTALQKRSIFKQPSMRVTTLKRPLTSASYDGLGGHSKDEEFPSPASNPKRSKPSSTLTSHKFKKLSQQKLTFSKE